MLFHKLLSHGFDNPHDRMIFTSIGFKTTAWRDDKVNMTTNVHISLDENLCKGCYICINVCPMDVYEKGPEIGPKGFRPVVIAHPDKCIKCNECELMCPDLAIIVREDHE